LEQSSEETIRLCALRVVRDKSQLSKVWKPQVLGEVGVIGLFDLVRNIELLDGFGARFEEREEKGLTSDEIHGNVDLPETSGKLR